MNTNQLTLRQLINLVECREGWKNKLFNYLYKKSKESFATQKVTSENSWKDGWKKEFSDGINKPPAIIEKIVTGKLNKRYEEICLLNQKFVKDDTMTIKQLIQLVSSTVGEKIEIKKFTKMINNE